MGTEQNVFAPILTVVLKNAQKSASPNIDRSVVTLHTAGEDLGRVEKDSVITLPSV